MKKRNFLMLLYFVFIIFLKLNSKVSFACDEIWHNSHIELESYEKQTVKLNIKKSGLYAVKTSGLNDIIMNLSSSEGNKVAPNFIEHDGNFFAIYSLNFDNLYYANIEMKVKKDSENSKLWLYFLDDSISIEQKNICGMIDEYGRDVYFKFIPKKTGTYMVKSTGKLDLKANIFNDKGEKVQYSSDVTGLNFRIFEDLDENKCYYIRVFSDNDKGNFDLMVSNKVLRNKDVIDLEMDDSLEKDFEGYIKGKENTMKFISDVDGEYKFVLISDMNLNIDIYDKDQKSVVKDFEYNKNYSYVTLYASKGEEYVVKVSSNIGETGAYKLRILNFQKLRKNSKDVVVGKNEGVITKDSKYLRFVCPDDGIYNFKNVGEHCLNLDFYDENGKLIKEGQNYKVFKNVYGIETKKGDILYLKASIDCCNSMYFKYEIEIINFSDLIKDCKQITVGLIDGYIEDLEQKCFYKFIPQKSGTYFAKVQSKTYFGLEVYNKTGDLMLEDVGKLDFIVAGKVKKGEPYYICLGGLIEEGGFSLEMILVDDMKKIAIEEDVEISNEIEYFGEVKRYEFCAREDGVYVPMISSLKNINITTRDENGNLVKNKNLKKGDKRIIEVYGEDSLTDIGSYCLKVENFTNKMNKAMKVVEEKDYQGNILISGMQNYYSFVPKDSGYYSIYTISDLDLESKVYNMEGDLIAENKKNRESNFCIVAKLEKGERYLINVTGKDTGLFILLIEQNRDVKSESEWIKLDRLNLDMIGYDGEEKIYKIIIPKSGKYFIDNYLDLQLSIEVYDKNGKLQKDLNEGDNHKLYELCQNNLYYIKVRALDCGFYNLKIESLEKAYNNAKLLTVECKSIDETNSLNVEYYKFYVEDKGLLIKKDTEDELKIYVLDIEGKMVISDVLEDSVTLDLEKGMYYLRCVSKGDIDIKTNCGYNHFVVNADF